MKLALVSILAVASLSLAACDDKKPEAPTPAATSTGAAAAPTAKASAAPGGGW